MFDWNNKSLEVILIFQVLKDGKVMFWTEHESCVPTDEQIKEMKKAGYKIKIKGDDQPDKSRNKWKLRKICYL